MPEKKQKPIKVRRTHQINVHLTPAEMNTLQANVLASSMTQSEYVREKLLEPHEDIRQIIREEIRHALGTES